MSVESLEGSEDGRLKIPERALEQIYFWARIRGPVVTCQKWAWAQDETNEMRRHLCFSQDFKP
jgi:hypothetical protein